MMMTRIIIIDNLVLQPFAQWRVSNQQTNSSTPEPPNTKPLAQWRVESADEFHLYCSGRVNCESCTVIVRTPPRQDIIVYLYQALALGKVRCASRHQHRYVQFTLKNGMSCIPLLKAMPLHSEGVADEDELLPLKLQRCMRCHHGPG
jgi:hypothetical protein